jgi:hypothetical protein
MRVAIYASIHLSPAAMENAISLGRDGVRTAGHVKEDSVVERTSHATFRPNRLPAGRQPSSDISRLRHGERHVITLPALLTWKDRRGVTRHAKAVTRNVSTQGVYIECSSGVSIPLYRLVLFNLERHVRHSNGLPDSLRQERILSAVYRVTLPKSSNEPVGLALRLIVGLSQAPPNKGSETRH